VAVSITDVGLPVTHITDESLTVAEPLVDSGDVGKEVKYVPTPGAADDT